jgi:hypothetical protein
MKHRHFLSGTCLTVVVMFLLAMSVHPAMAAEAINKEVACATCGGIDDLSPIPGFEGKKAPVVSIREIIPGNPVGASSGLTAAASANADGIQTQHISSAITLAIQDPRSGQQNSRVMAAAAGPESPDPALAAFITNMSSAGYDFTDESSHQYESTVQSDDFLTINSTQKQALTTGGFTQTASDTVLSHQDVTYYTFTNSTTQTQVYVMGVQRIDAGGNPVGDREYSVSPEFNPDGTAVAASASAQGLVRAASSGPSCWWLWVALVLVGLVVLAVIAALIFFSAGTYSLVAGALVAEAVWVTGAVAGSMIGGTFGIYNPSSFAAAWSDSLYASDIIFSASMIAALTAAFLLVVVLFLYTLYKLGVCMGWWDRDFWLNHDWDHAAGDFGLVDNGKPLELYKNDRILLSLFADTTVDKDAKWTIVSQGNLVIRKSGHVKTENGTIQTWIVEAADLGSHNLALKYETTKPVPPTVGITDYTLPITVKEIPWTITTVDAAFNPTPYEPLHSESQYVSLAIDPSGTPHISYFDEKNQRIMYATFANGAWTTKKVTDAVGYGSVLLAFDPAGNPAIGYGGYHINMGLEYAHLDGSAWSFEKVADGVGWGKIGEAGTGYFSSLVIDPEGNPHIVYNNGMKGDSASLMYATKNGTVWTNTVISQKEQNYNPSMVLDRDGLLHVAWIPIDSSGSIKYAEQDGSGNWLVKSVANTYDSSSDKNRHPGYQLSLALDSAGNPHISYYDTSDRDLKYVSWNGTDWNTETVPSTVDVGKFSSLAIDGSDQPFIAYYDATDKELRFATKNPGTDRWSIHTVDNSQEQVYQCGVGEYSSLALDSSGHPDIAYYDCPNHALKYAGWIG